MEREEWSCTMINEINQAAANANKPKEQYQSQQLDANDGNIEMRKKISN